MSILAYNNITLPYSVTTSFSQEDVYDDVSGTDWMCSKYDIAVECHIDIAYIGTLVPALVGRTTPDNASEIVKYIRKELMQPRRTLSFKFNGSEQIPSNTTFPGTVDVMNGPKPQSCNFRRLNNTHFILNYHIIAHYWENPSPGSTLGNVSNMPGHTALFNKWTETVEIDKTMASTRIRDGKYVIRSDNVLGKTADEIRSDLAVVGVPSGFIRESARYTISPDGLGLSYYIVDKEVFKNLPPYAYEATGTYTETATKLGAKVYGEVDLRLKGAPSNAVTPQNELVRIGILIVNQKLRSRGYNPATKNGFLEHAQVRVGMYENEVSFNWRVMLPVKNDRVNGSFPSLATAAAAASAAGMTGQQGGEAFPISDQTLGKITAFAGDLCNTPLTDVSTPNRYLDRGSYGLVLQAARYWDPDLPDTVLAPDNIIDPSDTVTSIDKVNHNHGVKPGRAGVERET